jgi:hypothetical protein
MPPKLEPLPQEQLIPLLQRTLISGRDIRALLRSDGFGECQSRNAQLLFVRDFCRTNCGITANNAFLSVGFDISAGNVAKILCKARKTCRAAGRPLSLTEEQEASVINYIRETSRARNFITRGAILRFIEETMWKTVTYSWLRSFLSRHGDEISLRVAKPQENPRLQTPRSHLNQYISLIQRLIHLSPAELIFNVDESGLSDWEERKQKEVIVIKDVEADDLHYGVDRSIRHQTLVCLISASGDAYCPLIIANDRRVLGIFETGVRAEIDLKIAIQPSPYINTDLFEQYISDVFIPSLETNRKMPGCEGKPAILFLDNVRAHCSDRLMERLARFQVLVVSYPPHTSQLFQVLDRLLFGRLKGAKKHLVRDLEKSAQLDHALRVFKAYELATTSTTIRASFRQTGFDYEQRDGVWYLIVNDQRLRGYPEFREVWEVDYPEESLSQRRTQQRWGWLNVAYFPRDFLGS